MLRLASCDSPLRTQNRPTTCDCREKKELLAKEEEARKRIERNEAYDQAWLAKEQAKAEERERLLEARLDAEKERCVACRYHRCHSRLG